MIDKVLGFEQPAVRRRKADNTSETYIYINEVPKKEKQRFLYNPHQRDRISEK